jgi:RecA-family ATPase
MATAENLIHELARKAAPEEPTRLYTLINDAEAEDQPPAPDGIEGTYPHGGLVVVFGPRGAGKTFLALGWSFCHATGLPWLGHAVHRGPVPYVMAEGRGGLGIRVRAQKRHLGVTGAVGVHFLTTAVPMLNPANVSRLLATIDTLDEPPAAIVYDTLSRTFAGGDENSSRDMAEYVAHVDRVREATGATAIVVHHSGHNSMDRERGSSVLGGAADTIIALRNRDGLLELA